MTRFRAAHGSNKPFSVYAGSREALLTHFVGVLLSGSGATSRGLLRYRLSPNVGSLKRLGGGALRHCHQICNFGQCNMQNRACQPQFQLIFKSRVCRAVRRWRPAECPLWAVPIISYCWRSNRLTTARFENCLSSCIRTQARTRRRKRLSRTVR